MHKESCMETIPGRHLYRQVLQFPIQSSSFKLLALTHQTLLLHKGLNVCKQLQCWISPQDLLPQAPLS